MRGGIPKAARTAITGWPCTAEWFQLLPPVRIDDIDELAAEIENLSQRYVRDGASGINFSSARSEVARTRFDQWDSKPTKLRCEPAMGEICHNPLT